MYSDPEKGALVTEGGSRWFQPDPGPATAAKTNQVDQGSPLTVINFFEALREERKAGKRPYVPGAIICWEFMVGNSNTRWHWGTAPDTPEPAIPWDAWIFPDGTPISYTEVAAFRRYATGVDDFLRFEDFLPLAEHDGDVTLPLPAGSAYIASSSAGGIPTSTRPLTDALFETTMWAPFPGDGNTTMIVRARETGIHNPVATHQMPSSEVVGEAATCSQDTKNLYQRTDISGAAYKGVGYRTLDVSNEADAVKACITSCCAWQGCAAWVVQSGTGPSKNDHNCTHNTSTCCWLKPNGKGMRVANAHSTAGVVTATPARPLLPPPPPPPAPGPPSPTNYSGYYVTVVGASKELVIERRDGQGKAKTLGRFDLRTIENGLVLEAWNILRVLAETSADKSSVMLSVWFNPYFSETGFVGNSSDAARTPKKLPPRLVVRDQIDCQQADDRTDLCSGEMVLTAGRRDSMIDYASALPLSAL